MTCCSMSARGCCDGHLSFGVEVKSDWCGVLKCLGRDHGPSKHVRVAVCSSEPVYACAVVQVMLKKQMR